MKIRFLGTGGSLPIPIPTCSCELCVEARDQGPPYQRCGNSLYLPDLGAVVDAPESIYASMNRYEIMDFEYLLLTHWHPDHINGLRVLQARDFTRHQRDTTSFVDFYEQTSPTLVTTKAVYSKVCELFNQLEYMVEETGHVDVHFLDSKPLTHNGHTISSIPYSLRGDDTEDATGFLVEKDGTRVVIVSDDARYLDVNELPSGIDLAIFECGMFTRGPDGSPLLTPTGKEKLSDELSHQEIRSRIEEVNPKMTYLTEIGHQYARSYDDYCSLSKEYSGIEFAYDGLVVTAQNTDSGNR